ncbi:hypothetical protein D3C86_1461190 [compost metagenome]
MKLSKFFCDPLLTMSGLRSQALRYLAKSVLVTRRADGMASFSAFRRAGVFPSRTNSVL